MTTTPDPATNPADDAFWADFDYYTQESRWA